MPDYLITTPDGKQIRVSAPEGADHSAIMNFVQAATGQIKTIPISGIGEKISDTNPPSMFSDIGKVIEGQVKPTDAQWAIDQLRATKPEEAAKFEEQYYRDTIGKEAREGKKWY